MLSWILIFLIISLIAGILGFGGISQLSGEIAQIIFFFFIILLLVSLIASVVH